MANQFDAMASGHLCLDIVPEIPDTVMTMTKQLAKLVGDYQSRFGGKPSVIFLQKHGLFVSADRPDAAGA
ncbi:MAG: hypothetical protein MUP16_00005, partial [Sedimentisphaerales bacterium]|nr:hypothetical protein [Sedimentisphaerales bacterium]